MPLEVVYNNHSPAPIYGGYLPWTGVYCGAWSTPGAVSACCTWHMCWLYVCVVVLGAYLVLSVLTALGICVGYMWFLERTYVLAICIVGCLACTWCKRGVALVKFQNFPISYGVMGHICILWDMYALTRKKVNYVLWSFHTMCTDIYTIKIRKPNKWHGEFTRVPRFKM